MQHTRRALALFLPLLLFASPRAESEYSPTTTPDLRGISVVRVEPDSTQRLWRVGIEGVRGPAGKEP